VPNNAFLELGHLEQHNRGFGKNFPGLSWKGSHLHFWKKQKFDWVWGRTGPNST